MNPKPEATSKLVISGKKEEYKPPGRRILPCYGNFKLFCCCLNVCLSVCLFVSLFVETEFHVSQTSLQPTV